MPRDGRSIRGSSISVSPGLRISRIIYSKVSLNSLLSSSTGFTSIEGIRYATGWPLLSSSTRSPIGYDRYENSKLAKKASLKENCEIQDHADSVDDAIRTR